MTLKKIFQLERIFCVHLHDILKRLLVKVCLDAWFTSWYRFVAFRVTFNDLCCWTKRCGILSRIHIRLTDKSWKTSPNEFVLHFRLFWYFADIKLEVSTGRLHYNIINVIQFIQTFVISSYFDDIETNLPIGKHTLRLFAWYFGKIVGKGLFQGFIFVFV